MGRRPVEPAAWTRDPGCTRWSSARPVVRVGAGDTASVVYRVTVTNATARFRRFAPTAAVQQAGEHGASGGERPVTDGWGRCCPTRRGLDGYADAVGDGRSGARRVVGASQPAGSSYTVQAVDVGTTDHRARDGVEQRGDGVEDSAPTAAVPPVGPVEHGGSGGERPAPTVGQSLTYTAGTWTGRTDAVGDGAVVHAPAMRGRPGLGCVVHGCRPATSGSRSSCARRRSTAVAR